MSQNSIDHLTMEIKNDQLSSSYGKPTGHIFKDLSSKIRTFLGSFCERTTVASLLRKKCVVLLSIFLCSGLAHEIKTTMNIVPSLFCILYICLAYQILEDIVRWSYLRKINQWSQEVACLFEITHKIALTLFLFTLNMKYEGVIGEGFMLLTPLVFLLETALCWKNYSTSHSQNIVPRFFYILQSSLIAAKMNNVIDFEWKTTLVFLWIYLGINALYAILAGLLYVAVGLSAILNSEREYLSLLKNEAIGYIWHICYNAFSVAGIVFFIGYFGETEGTVETGLYFAQKLSLFLGIYTVILFPLLRKQTVDFFQDLLTMLHVQVTAEAEYVQKKYNLVKTQNFNKKEFFLMISSTYFSLLKDIVESMPLNISEDENLDVSQEKPLCYICENNESDAIIKECGHGGVCCDCVVKSMEYKNECMECRKPVKAIYKIETHSRNEGKTIVQASEFAQVLEV